MKPAGKKITPCVRRFGVRGDRIQTGNGNEPGSTKTGE